MAAQSMPALPELRLGRTLTVAELAAVADRRMRLTVPPAVLERLAATRAAADAVAAARPVYGRSTGVGANRGTTVDDPAAHARSLLHSHATAAGPLRPARRVRALLAVRAAQLAAAGSGTGSGIAPDVLPALIRLLDREDPPPVRAWGGVGTGDLAALATVALALDLPLDAGDALAFLSSNAGVLADAALALADLAVLADAATAVAALTCHAVAGSTEAWSELAAAASPTPGAGRVCATMRRLTAGGAPAARIQDPFGLRTLPQVHGLLLDTLAAATRLVETAVATPSENPLFGVDPPRVAHHGGFHAAPLATALDTLRSTVAQSATLSRTRLALLVDPAWTGLRAFLATGPAAASGVMPLEYVGAAATGELVAAATPVAVQTAVLSLGVEDDASFAPLAATLALDGVAAYRTVIACELVAALRALRQQHRSPGGVEALLGTAARLPVDDSDRDLTADIAAAEALLPSLATA